MRPVVAIIVILVIVVVLVMAFVILRGVAIVNKTCTANRTFGSVVTAQWAIELRNDGTSTKSVVVQYLLDGNVQSTQTYTLSPGQVQTFTETFNSFSYPGSGQPSCDSRPA